MNARNYRTSFNLSQLDFPAIDGLGTQSDFTQTEPPTLSNNNVVLKITKTFILIDDYTNKQYEVFKAQSIYEIPANEIKTRGDIYEFYNDATLLLNEAYQYVQKQTKLPILSFPTRPIEAYESEIDSVFYLLNSRN